MANFDIIFLTGYVTFLVLFIGCAIYSSWRHEKSFQEWYRQALKEHEAKMAQAAIREREGLNKGLSL